MLGEGRVRLQDSGEEYVVTFPSGYCRLQGRGGVQVQAVLGHRAEHGGGAGLQPGEQKGGGEGGGRVERPADGQVGHRKGRDIPRRDAAEDAGEAGAAGGRAGEVRVAPPLAGGDGRPQGQQDRGGHGGQVRTGAALEGGGQGQEGGGGQAGVQDVQLGRRDLAVQAAARQLVEHRLDQLRSLDIT